MNIEHIALQGGRENMLLCLVWYMSHVPGLLLYTDQCNVELTIKLKINNKKRHYSPENFNTVQAQDLWCFRVNVKAHGKAVYFAQPPKK